MMLIRTLFSLVPIALLLSFTANADDAAADREKILKIFPELSAGAITPSPIPGLYQVMLRGQISYVSADGRYLLQGDIYDTVAEANLTERHRELARQSAIDEIAESNMIVFRPEVVKHTVTVFTDIDCGFCRKLHRQIDAYNDRGIEIRYMFYPRSGPNTDSWFKAEKVWCADNRNMALTRAKTGVTINSVNCNPTPVAQHFELGRSIGIRGTPALILDGGELIPGYVSPNELLEYLDE